MRHPRKLEDRLAAAEGVSMNRRLHWDEVYRAREESQLSWHQHEPRVSLELIRECCDSGRRIIDVGSGTSLLAGCLADAGYSDVAVLDVSESALDLARTRLGERAREVRWIVDDVTTTTQIEPGTIDLWHDRAVFHFLTDAADRRKYVQRAAASVRPGGHAVIATFALDGPEQCSSLPVQRYDAATLASQFSPAFSLVKSISETHVTPWGKAQAFVYVVMRRG